VSRIFAYCRVSTEDQTTENQVQEIRTAGFALEPHRVIEETISGGIAASQRPGFAKLIDRLERGDGLVVAKLDRLGRNTIDVLSTLDRLTVMGVRVHCLALGGVDLTSAAGKMTVGVLAAVAAFERDLLIERTNSGLRRAWAEGKKSGRRPVLTDRKRAEVHAAVRAGKTAREHGVSRQTIARTLADAATAAWREGIAAGR
jgi:putative DNA-invertase from lambdoid prophage Rac